MIRRRREHRRLGLGRVFGSGSPPPKEPKGPCSRHEEAQHRSDNDRPLHRAARLPGPCARASPPRRRVGRVGAVGGSVDRMGACDGDVAGGRCMRLTLRGKLRGRRQRRAGRELDRACLRLGSKRGDRVRSGRWAARHQLGRVKGSLRAGSLRPQGRRELGDALEPVLWSFLQAPPDDRVDPSREAGLQEARRRRIFPKYETDDLGH